MKTIFTLLLSTIFSIAAMAYDGTRLTVTSVSNNKVFVEVDGRRYDLDDNTLSLSSIRPGTHNIRVLREMKRKTGVNFGNRREETIYNIKATFRNGYHFDILVNRFGKVMIDERRIDPNDDWYNDDDYYDRNDDRNRDRDNTYDNGDDRDDSDYGNDDRDNRDNPGYENDRKNDDPRYDNNYSRAMTNNDFDQAKESLRREWFENTRLETAKQVIDRNFFTSQQVKEMVLLFTFENNRLDIAKYAFGKTVDKGNYFVVNDAFTFNNNKEALKEYIRQYK
ncbi:MAG TPA: DUF4476 domain-containing protein [Chitinophagaceae bacterium]|nr:DUF4476 domain-containing protein [Chitinophagaceae bacterium]